MLCNLISVLIWSPTKCVLAEDGFKDSSSVSFVTFAEKYPQWSLLLRKIPDIEFFQIYFLKFAKYWT